MKITAREIATTTEHLRAANIPARIVYAVWRITESTCKPTDDEIMETWLKIS